MAASAPPFPGAGPVQTGWLRGWLQWLALLGTLVFRGLSFWLPLLPGMLLARRISRQ